jgi:serine/threonine protein kinase/tetratricopeptide (TPR) repeat protein
MSEPSSKPSAKPSPKPPPKRLADFEIVRRLGAGGMAEVFLAKKRGAEGTYKLLVLKRILPAYGSSRRFRSMFAEEAQLATRLNHPNIVQVYDFQDYGEEGQLLSMEFVEGPDLKRLVRVAQAQNRRIPPFVAAYTVAEVAKGLHYAHERKDEAGRPLDIVHRDVSPQNILLSFDGAVKIADFGIASANLFREEPGVLKGKTAYMSPEQARAERVTRRTDIYSLGVVFFELLTGRSLHGAAEGAELLELVRTGVVEPPSTFVRELPSELEEIAMRCLAKNPDERFETGRDLAGAISRALFQRQQLVDAHVLETTIADFVGREQMSPVEPKGSEIFGESQLGSEASVGLSVLETRGTASTEPRADERTGPGGPGTSGRDRSNREVRHVAIVTLKLHGQEELAQAVGEPQAARVLAQLKATLGEAAFRRGARWAWETVDGQPAPTSARAVVGLMANPSRAPADAVWLAIDVHEVVRGSTEDLPVRLSASVGIVRGIAMGRRDKAGHLIQHELQESANHLSDLLGAQAPPGVSWVAGGLYRLVRRDFVWGDAPTVRIPEYERLGLPQNLRIYALLRPHTREERLQDLHSLPSDLVGRDAELADLHSAYYGVVGGEQSPAKVGARVVHGEMGIGKTALVSAFLAELPPDARVVAIECTPALSEVPHATVSDWFRELTGVHADHSLEEAAGLVAAALGNPEEPEAREVVTAIAELCTGHVRPVADDGDADAVRTRQLIALGIRGLLSVATRSGPLVTVLDGIQWCDRQSLDPFAEFFRSGEPLPVLALLTTRPDDRVTPYIDGLVRVELKGLSTENQIRLLQTRLGVAEGVAQACSDLVPRAAGNPFFLLEMVDTLLERGQLEIRERPDRKQELVTIERPGQPAIPLPSTLEQLIADRLNELPLDEHGLVEWLAVAGGPLTYRELESFAGPTARDLMSRLTQRGLCDERGESVDVRHPLTRDVAYRTLERRRRAQMHHDIGMHLAKTPLAKGLTAAVVARHLARGGARPQAGAAYLEAGHAARNGHQLALARRYYRRAVALLSDGDVGLLEAHEALEGIFRMQGRWRERRAHLRALRSLAKERKSPRWVATALLATAQFELDSGRLAKGLESAQRGELVATQAGSCQLEVRARALIAETLHDLGDMQGALAAVDRALATADTNDVPARQRAEVLRLRGTLLRRVGRVHEAMEAQAEAVAVFRQVGARRLEARAKNSLAYALLVLGRFEDGITLALDAISIDLAVGGRFQIAKTLSTIGECYVALGDYERGLAYMRRSREAHERYGEQDSRADTLLSLAEILFECGDFAGAETLVGDAGALSAVTGSAYDSVHEKLLRAVLARQAGDPAKAVMHAFDARQSAEAQAYVAFHFYAMAIEASARVEMGEQHTGILLATTAMGAIETLQGSEYGLFTRNLCCDALRKAGSPQAEEMRARASDHVRRLLSYIRDPVLKGLFLRRRVVREILGNATADALAVASGAVLEQGQPHIASVSPGVPVVSEP